MISILLYLFRKHWGNAASESRESLSMKATLQSGAYLSKLPFFLIWSYIVASPGDLLFSDSALHTMTPTLWRLCSFSCSGLFLLLRPHSSHLLHSFIFWDIKIMTVISLCFDIKGKTIKTKKVMSCLWK